MDGPTPNKLIKSIYSLIKQQNIKTYHIISNFCNLKFYWHQTKYWNFNKVTKNPFPQILGRNQSVYAVKQFIQLHAHQYLSLTGHILLWGSKMEQLQFMAAKIWVCSSVQKSILLQFEKFNFSKMVGKWYLGAKMEKFLFIVFLMRNVRWRKLICLSLNKTFQLLILK